MVLVISRYYSLLFPITKHVFVVATYTGARLSRIISLRLLPSLPLLLLYFFFVAIIIDFPPRLSP
jgi:hypothetical protein